MRAAELGEKEGGCSMPAVLCKRALSHAVQPAWLTPPCCLPPSPPLSRSHSSSTVLRTSRQSSLVCASVAGVARPELVRRLKLNWQLSPEASTCNPASPAGRCRHIGLQEPLHVRQLPSRSRGAAETLLCKPHKRSASARVEQGGSGAGHPT